MAVAAQNDTRTATGLFPVYDSSGETYGEDLAGFLTPAIYKAFKQSHRELILLNPGAGYSLVDEAASLEFARNAGVKTVLIPRLAPTSRKTFNDNSPRLRLEAKAVDVATGATLHSLVLSEQVNRRELESGFAEGAFDAQRGADRWVVVFSLKSEKVERQPIGRELTSMARAMRDNILAFNKGELVYPSAALHQGARPPSCRADFTIRYARQKTNSKAYQLYVNDRDESASTDNNGVTPITMKSGLNVFYVTVRDTPYRMPAQKVYTINRWMECSPAERNVTLEIGGAGEALLLTSS